jgi:hypothetical protein
VTNPFPLQAEKEDDKSIYVVQERRGWIHPCWHVNVGEKNEIPPSSLGKS